jgi:hypothetical protein
MSPQPPDFNHLLAAGRTFDYNQFRDGCVVTVRVVPAADLRLPSGRVVAAEPWAYSREEAEERVFVQRAEPGTYPVQLIMADYYDPGNPQDNTHFSVVGAARLVIRDEPTARWRLALRDGQDDTRLAADEFYGYPVDGGAGSFASPELFDAFADEEAADDLTADIMFRVGDSVVYTDEETGNNLVAFSSGGGDGRFGTWVGYTAEGEVSCFVTDFGALTHEEGDGVACAAGPIAPPEPVYKRRGPASHGTGAQLLVGQTLSRRQTLTSPSGGFILAYQDDGNLVLYPYDQDGAIWASNTDGNSVGECVLQEDGNLVVYNREGRAVWASGTDGQPVIRLIVQDHGVLALTDATGTKIWSVGGPPAVPGHAGRTEARTRAVTRGRPATPARPAIPARPKVPAVPARPRPPAQPVTTTELDQHGVPGTD